MPASSTASPSFVERIPEGDDRPRRVCTGCGFVDYDRPRVVVGAVATLGARVLLCRRAIEPRRGLWTLPAGHLESRESAVDGATREAFEEARARIEIDGVLGVYSEPEHSQVQIVYRARLAAPTFAPGPESLEVALFRWHEIPWTELAFPGDAAALRDAAAALAADEPEHPSAAEAHVLGEPGSTTGGGAADEVFG